MSKVKVCNPANAERHFENALKYYTLAIEIDPKNAILYCNRAFVQNKLECYGAALEDANMSIELDPTYIKGYYRRATANIGINKLKDALRDLKLVIKHVPGDKDAQTKIKNIEVTIKREAFEAAIHADHETKLPSTTINLESMAVDSSYTGPILEEKITLDFVMSMLDYFRDQKLIHRRFAYKVTIRAISYVDFVRLHCILSRTAVSCRHCYS
jgi:serine/threonine-protein phosphatase 5